MKICEIEGCNNPVFSKGRCRFHQIRSPIKKKSFIKKKVKVNVAKNTQMKDFFLEIWKERYPHNCVICNEPAKDSHHILERRLFKDGGYYLDNGASLCEKHHLLAELTELSCDEIREKAGIANIIIPDHLYSDVEYDKWGNEILFNGLRVKGELFNDLSVQKILAPVINKFTEQVKYPRTYHLPWSPGMTRDDRMMDSIERFINKKSLQLTYGNSRFSRTRG
jgi:hypothetical protein